MPLSFFIRISFFLSFFLSMYLLWRGGVYHLLSVCVLCFFFLHSFSLYIFFLNASVPLPNSHFYLSFDFLSFFPHQFCCLYFSTRFSLEFFRSFIFIFLLLTHLFFCLLFQTHFYLAYKQHYRRQNQSPPRTPPTNNRSFITATSSEWNPKSAISLTEICNESFMAGIFLRLVKGVPPRLNGADPENAHTQMMISAHKNLCYI